MAEGTDTVDCLCGAQLAAAGVDADLHSVGNGHRVDGRLMRPYEVRILRICCLSVSGIEDEHLFNEAVAVPVILLPVCHLVLGEVHSILHHRIYECRLVSARGVVLAISGISLRQVYRTYHVEVDLELSATLSLEVVTHATLESERLVGVVLSVDDLLVEVERMLRLELGVGEVGKDDKTFLLALEFASLYLFTGIDVRADSRMAFSRAAFCATTASYSLCRAESSTLENTPADGVCL